LSTPTRRIIDVTQRPWARHRELQRFLGPYVRERQAGIFFSQDTPSPQRRLVAAAFLKLPAALQAICREYDVTFSCCQGSTVFGNSSSFYGDFEQSCRQYISPHIEVGKRSRSRSLLLPHLTHEAAHLWWRHLPAEARRQYARFLVQSCQPGKVEVTRYVQGLFQIWCEALALPDTATFREENRLRHQRLWVEESFCDTVAILHVAGYPSRNRQSTVDIGQRRKQVRELAGLALAEPACPDRQPVLVCR